MAASDVALTAVLWFDKLGDQAAPWLRQFGDPNLRPDCERLGAHREVRGLQGARSSTATTPCRSGCNMHGWLCPVHGKNY